MSSDIEIAQAAKLQRISKVALDRLGIAEEQLQLRAVFQIRDGHDSRAAFHAIHETKNVGHPRPRIKVRAQ